MRQLIFDLPGLKALRQPASKQLREADRRLVIEILARLMARPLHRPDRPEATND